MKDRAPGLQVAEDFEAPPGWAPVAVFNSTRQAHEAGLAILAMGHAYWLLPVESSFVLCVAEEWIPAVTKELAEMGSLRKSYPSESDDSFYPEREVGATGFILYALLLCACFVVQNQAPISEPGRVDAGLMIEQAQWWRAFTALTLHGDVVHLVSNLVAGVGFALLLTRYFGAGVGWFLILLAGGAGNAVNAWVQYPEAHYSLGASTAVFGALGLITGVALWIAVREPAQRWATPRWLLPAFGGFTLLGLLGVGDGIDGRIDVAAHICGFLCGGALGLVSATRQATLFRLEQRYGRWIGLGALVLIGVAWLAALSI